MDVIVYGVVFTSINVYLQNEDETFAGPLISPIDQQGGTFAKIYLIDVSNDAIPDLLLISWFDFSMTILLGHGNGTFHYANISTHLPALLNPLFDFGKGWQISNCYKF